MNNNNVVSADAAGDLTGKEYRVLTLGTTGVTLATSGDAIIGTLVRAMPHQEDGVYAGKSVGVQLLGDSLHFATMGATSAAVAKGAGLILDTDGDNPGKLIPSESSPVAIAWEAFTAADNAVVRVLFL